jgi:hypothetical protein
VIRAGFLDSESRQDLIELTRDGLAAHRLARRANALLLLDDGMSCEAVAQVLYLDDDTIRTWHGCIRRMGSRAWRASATKARSRSCVYRFGTLTLALLIIVMLARSPAARPPMRRPLYGQSHQDGFMTRYQGTDRDGGQWTGTSYQQGFTTYFAPDPSDCATQSLC